MTRPLIAGVALVAIVLGILGVSAAALTGRSVARGTDPTMEPTPVVRPYTHAADFSWVAGRLERSPLEGGFWILIYQQEGDPPDRYRGRFVLGTDPRLTGFSPGDLVVVHGGIAPEQISIFMAGTIYQFDRIERL